MRTTTKRNLKPTILALSIGAAFHTLAPGLAQAQTADTKPAVSLPQIDVIGQDDADIARQAGAASIISSETIELVQPRSTEEVLRRVPGLTIKPEEESAVVLNLGIRGLSATDPKTLILEDGVPVAPGLFVGNARYFSPRIQRIDSIEVLKGASSLRYGPSTIGGVINFRTKQPKEGFSFQSSVGTWNTRTAIAEIGGKSTSGDAVFGAVLSKAKSDGFMDKGYDMTDIMLKAGMAIGDNQFLGLKYSYYENEANISYRGLFLEEFQAGSKRNPAPDDFFLTERHAFDINHQWDVNDKLRINTLAYYSTVSRDYYRFAVDRNASLAARQWIFTDNVNGNNRSFERYGMETRAFLKNTLLGVNGEMELGLRYLNEELDDQTVLAVRSAPRTPNVGRGGLGRDRLDTAESVALFAQNRFEVTERFALTPGARVEYYTQDRLNRQNLSQQGNTSNTEVIPGLSASYQLNPSAQLFGSVHKAFAPAQTDDALVVQNGVLVDQELDAERSTNLEIGIRGKTEKIRYEAAAFRLDFSNQIIPSNSNPNFQRTNAGETLHQGLEGAIDVLIGGGFNVEASATWIPTAEFRGSRAIGGNRVPYAPKVVGNLGLGYSQGPLRTLLSVNYTGSQFTDEANTKPIVVATPASERTTGEIPSYSTIDLSARYTVNKQLNVFGSIKNLADRRYIASFREGLYIGPERSIEVGLRYNF